MEQQIKNPYDNPFMQMLTRIGEIMIANFLFLICCLPIITVGASAAGLNKVTQNIVLDGEGGVFKTFFKGFKENFRQATLLWLAELVIAVAAVCYKLIIETYCGGTSLGSVFNGVLFVVVLLLLGFGVYVTPLMVRYSNTLRQHVKNAMLLSIIKLPRTIGLTLLALLMPAILYFSVTTFIQTLFFWLIGGFAFISYMSHVLLKPVFKELEATENGQGIGVMN